LGIILKRNGFTLIELVIVIIVLGVLSATAVPKFVALQDDARQASMEGLKGALESASTLTYMQTQIEGLGTLADETLSSGIRIRYGYPQATQSNLKRVLDFTEDDWKLSDSTPVIFTFESDTSDLTVAEIQQDSICKLTYTGAAQFERPMIVITGCED